MKKNYIDEKGNYHNVQNLTLTQIYDSGVEDGYKMGKEAQLQPRGEWKGSDVIYCSECHADAKLDYVGGAYMQTRSAFCPACGVKMKKKEAGK